MLARTLACCIVVAGASACGDLLGLDDYQDQTAPSSSAAGGASAGGAADVGAGAAGGAVQIPAPRGYYTFEETSSLPDEIESHDGILEGGPTLVIGQVGNALAFDGQDDGVMFPLWPTLPRLTIALWLRFEMVQNMDVDLPILERWAYQTDERSVYFTMRNGQLAAQVSVHGGSSGNPYADLGPAQFIKWMHYVIRWDGMRLSVHIDGIEMRQTQGEGSGDLANSELVPVFLARNRYMSANAWLRAAYDELVIWDVALDNDAIQALYEVGVVNQPATSLWE